MPAVFCPKCRTVSRVPDGTLIGVVTCSGCRASLPVPRPRAPFDSGAVEIGVDPDLPPSEQPTDRIRRVPRR